MLNFFKNLFDENKRSLDKFQAVVEQINALEPKIKRLSDEALAGQTQKFTTAVAALRKQGRRDAEILDQLLPEAFATVRETARRVLGMRHFDVQLIAGIALHHGMVTEQKTGEGKTLTVTAPLYLNSLLGKGVHLVTVNDYLAEIGVGWMGPIYHFLGLNVAVIIHDQAKRYNPAIDSENRGDERLEHFARISRQEAYAADITYGTNNEFGFDYLRDNMVQTIDQMVQRPENTHQFAIVDEADSILIDEARTPLIISAPDAEPTQQYYQFSHMVQSLTKDQDFKVDEKARSVTLTDLGVKRIEQKLGVSNLYEESFDVIHHVEAALKANSLFHRDKEYIVREGQVVIVDEHTGRLMFGRRYSDGLHQAIEAKEGVTIQQESRTLATISIQNYFRQYLKLAGMTGTAATEAEEFQKIYTMPVLVVPTHRPVTRQDTHDVVYKTTAAKYTAIAKEVERLHAIGRPILIGTRSIENNDVVADYLKRKKISHQVLNAKNNEKEAFVIADAGKEGAITVATNIAGRGVDIVLGGAKPELKDYRTSEKKARVTAADEKLVAALQLPASVDPRLYRLKEYQQAIQDWQERNNKVRSLGGLAIVGTERHESRRIDNQLRGRSGRQGDPGSSQFFLSLEDEIMRIFGGEHISKLMDILKIEEDQPIENGMVGKAIESAQVKVEGFFFDQRKRLVEFDDVMNQQRQIMYKRRRSLLEKGSGETTTDLKTQIQGYLADEIRSAIHAHTVDHPDAPDYDAIVKDFVTLIPFDDASQKRIRQEISKLDNTDAMIEHFVGMADHTYTARETAAGADQMRLLERVVTLSTIDEKWMDHIDEIDNLRQGIWLRGDKNTVLAEYKREAFTMFDDLITTINATIASRIFRVQLNTQPTFARPIQGTEKKDSIHESLRKEVADATLPGTAITAGRSVKGNVSDLAAALGSAKATKKAEPGSKQMKIGRNDPCPCGAINPETGNPYKYKKCGMINAPWHIT